MILVILNKLIRKKTIITMLPDIKNFPVNWIDGMKISSGDFISLENAVQDGVRDVQATRLHEFNYGLLPTSHPEVDNYPKLVYDYVNNVLVLKECRALTPAGQRIEITEANYERKKFPALLPATPVSVQESGHFDVYLLVDPLVRAGAGDFAQNNPPRYVAVSPTYELSVRPHDGVYIEQENFLKISEIEVREGRVDILTSMGAYFPPCTTMNAFAPLLRKHGDGEERLKGLVQHYHHLIDRVGGETLNRDAKEAIAEVMALAEKLVMPIVNSLSYYRHILPVCPPIFTLVYFKDYARSVRFHLNRQFRTNALTQFKPKLMELTLNLERTEPRHAALRLAFDQIKELLDELNEFLLKLNKHDYNAPFQVVIHNQSGPGDRQNQSGPRTQRPPEPEQVESPKGETPGPQLGKKEPERVF
jgi:hypothetical protein